MRPLAFALLLPLALMPQDSRALRPIDIGARKALVIGNAAYPAGAALKNPTNDARAMRDSLQRLGFQVQLLENINKRQLSEGVEQFARTLGERDLALVYFAGHGVQVDGENYLIPVDFQGQSEADVRYDAYHAGKLRDRLEESPARVRVLVFDACRNNPYRFKRSGVQGLARMTSNAKGTAILFGAGDGQTADDNAAGSNGLFTAEFLKAIETPGLGIDQVFKRVQAEVEARSGGRQFPAVYDQIIGSLVLRPGVAAPVAPVDAESTYWQECRAYKGEFCRIYLERYPAGQFARLARAYLAPTPDPVNPPAIVSPPVDRGQRVVNPKDGLAYVRIPAGEFMMGCSPGDSLCHDDEKPVRVRLSKRFYLGESEVTQEAYQKLMGDNPSRIRESYRPVDRVSAFDAQRYCGLIGGRLPTAAEWEWAARGGVSGARYGAAEDVGWFESANTEAVKAKMANGYGLYDMLGNVWEWTSTWYSKDNVGGIDPEGPRTGQQLEARGGAWNNELRHLRVSRRFGLPPANAYYNVGFRCVWE